MAIGNVKRNPRGGFYHTRLGRTVHVAIAAHALARKSDRLRTPQNDRKARVRRRWNMANHRDMGFLAKFRDAHPPPSVPNWLSRALSVLALSLVINFVFLPHFLPHDELARVYSPSWQVGEYKTCTTLKGFPKSSR